MIKITFQHPTNQFEFVKFEIEREDDFSPEEIKRTIDLYLEPFQENPPLSSEEFDLFIYNMVTGKNGNHVESLEMMSQGQKSFVQVLKRAIKRANYQAKE